MTEPIICKTLRQAQGANGYRLTVDGKKDLIFNDQLKKL